MLCTRRRGSCRSGRLLRPAGPTPISALGRGSCWHPPAGRRHDEHHCLRGDLPHPLLLETTLDETTGTPLTALSHVRSRRVLTKRTAAALQALLAGVVAGAPAMRPPCPARPRQARPHGPDRSVFRRYRAEKLLVCGFCPGRAAPLYHRGAAGHAGRACLFQRGHLCPGGGRAGNSGPVAHGFSLLSRAFVLSYTCICMQSL